MNTDLPAQTAAQLPPAGWYPDPAGSGGQAYWTGTEWGQPTVASVKPKKKSHTKLVVAVGVVCGLIMIGKLADKPDAQAQESAPPAATATSASASPTPAAAPSTTVPAEPVKAPAAPATETASAGQCQSAPPVLLALIDGSFLRGQHLANSQAVYDGLDGRIYIGGDIARADGQIESSRNTWMVDDSQALYVVYSMTSDARKASYFPDGRDVAGDWMTFHQAVTACVGR